MKTSQKPQQPRSPPKVKSYANGARTIPIRTKEEKLLNDSKISGFLNKMIDEGKLTAKYASILNKRRVLYAKGKDLYSSFRENFGDFKAVYSEVKKQSLGDMGDEGTMQKFYDMLIDNYAVLYLTRLPGDKSKYPKKLMPLSRHEDQNKLFTFDVSGFYALLIESEANKSSVVYLILIMSLILIVVLFPIWPLKVKLGVLWTIFWVLVGLIMLIFGMILVALMGFLLGYDVSIMPNLDDSKLSWKNRVFKDFITAEKREDPLWLIIVRMTFLVSFVSLCLMSYYHPYYWKWTFKLIKGWYRQSYSFIKSQLISNHYNKGLIQPVDNPVGGFDEDIFNL